LLYTRIDLGYPAWYSGIVNVVACALLVFSSKKIIAQNTGIS